MKIRQIDSRELAAVVDIDREVFPEHPYGPIVMRQMQEVSGGLFLVADGGTLAGFAIGLREADRPESAWMMSLAVGTAFRGRGVGRALVKRFLAELKTRRIESCRLTVEPENQTARSLYTSFGWRIERERQDYFGSETRVLMNLDLQ